MFAGRNPYTAHTPLDPHGEIFFEVRLVLV
jgi:hypothetical protein